MAFSSGIQITSFIFTLIIFVCQVQISKCEVYEEENEERIDLNDIVLQDSELPDYELGESVGQEYFVVEQMNDFVENLEIPEYSNEDTKVLSRQKRSVSRKRRGYPKWFRQACRRHFCGSYDCSTFLYAKGKMLCKHCRVASCRKGSKVLGMSRH